MIINHPKQELETHNIGRTASFKMKPDRQAFKNLSSGLYSNKILAVIRETVSNAVDSHIVSGKANVPVKVHLPNVYEPYFSVRDEGTGLCEDTVMELYVTYFESDKQANGNVSGGFGLGSKSPLAISDTFAITSIFDGYKKTYSVYYDTDGMPAITLMSTEATTEHSGIEINVPTNPDDCETFIKEAQWVFRFYPVRPEISGADVVYTTEDWKMSGNGWRLNNADGRSTSVRAIVGSIMYDVNLYHLTFNPMIKGCYYINFTVNEVELTPSRESISYSDVTTKAIQAKLTQVCADSDSVFQVEIDKQPDPIKAATFINSVRELDYDKEFAFNGAKHVLRKLVDDSQLSVNHLFGNPNLALNTDNYPIRSYSFSMGRWSNAKNDHQYPMENSAYTVAARVLRSVYPNRHYGNKVTWLRAGNAKAIDKRIRQYATDNNLRSDKQVAFVVFEGLAEAKLKEVCALYEIDIASIQDADTFLPQTVKAPRAPGSANAYRLNGSWETNKVAQIQGKDIFYAIDTDENRQDKRVFNSLHQVRAVLKEATGFVIEDRPYYLIPQRNMKFLDKKNLIELAPYVKDLLAKNEAKIRAYVVKNGVQRKASEYAQSRRATGPFQALGYNLKDTGVDPARFDLYTNYSVPMEPEVNKAATAQIEIMKSHLAKYPMLEHTTPGYGGHDVRVARHYIELWDAAQAAGVKMPTV